jgi:putative ABC transport system permease protein
VNEAAARRYWPGTDPIGRRTSRGEVVGVVRNSREKGLTVEPRPTIYLPLLQNYTPDLTVHVRSAIAPETVFASLRREVRGLDATLPLYNVGTLAQQRDGALYSERVAAALLTLFGLLAVTLAAVGLYGVLSYSVTERTREMGIRVTQGAQPRDLLKLVIGKGMLLAAVGCVVGVAAAFALSRLVRQLLFGVRPHDPLTFVAVTLLLAAVAFASCWIPARRVTGLSPMTALRHD